MHRRGDKGDRGNRDVVGKSDAMFACKRDGMTDDTSAKEQ